MMFYRRGDIGISPTQTTPKPVWNRPKVAGAGPFSAWNHVAWFALLSGLYTLVVVQWSFFAGRLSIDPVYDDVAYFLDGLLRLGALYQHGPDGFLKSLASYPPHSPWSTVLATGSFALFGINDWAPYVANGILVFFLLLIGYHILATRKLADVVAMSALILALPLTFRAVFEFRPDFAVGLATAFSVVLTLKLACSRGVRHHPGYYLAAGAIAGSAILIKPSFLLHTLAMFLGTICLGELCRFILTRHIGSGVWHRAGLMVAGFLLASGAYLALEWRWILDYIQLNTGAGKDAAIWRMPGGLAATVQSYLLGRLNLNLGLFQAFLFTLILIGLGACIKKRDFHSVAFMLAAMTAASASLAIVTLSQVNSFFFGMPWQTCVVFVGIFALGRLSDFFATPLFSLGLVVAVLIISYFNPLLPDEWGFEHGSDTDVRASINTKAVEELAQAAALKDHLGTKKAAVVFVTFAGNVNASAQTWIASKLAKDQVLLFTDLHLAGSFDEQMAGIMDADFVEVASADARWMYRGLPSSPLQTSIVTSLRATPSFSELPPIVGRQGTLYLFNHQTAPGH